MREPVHETPEAAAPASPASRSRRPARAVLVALALASLVGAGAIPLGQAFWPGPAVAAPGPGAGGTAAVAMPGFADIVERVAPAVVTVEVAQAGPAALAEREGGEFEFRIPGVPPGSPFEEYFKRFFGAPVPGAPEGQGPGARGEAKAVGSGFFVDARGYVVTNNHVVADADKITVIVKGGERFEARLVGRDPKTDLALIKIEGEKPFPFVAWGDSDSIRVGDWVVAVGNPFGLGGTVTAGIVSARGREIGVGPYDDFLQIDAPINRGNSGGPTFNPKGEVIGVNTAIFSPTGASVGIGFAVPSNEARAVIASLKDTGRVERGWLGVQIQGVTPEMAESLGLKKAAGAIVVAVSEGSPAAKAKIERGDVVLALDGTAIASPRELARTVARLKPGANASFTVWRDGREVKLGVAIVRLPDETAVAGAGPAAVAGDAVLGMKLAALDQGARQSFGIPDEVKGVVIAGVAPNGVAAEKGLRAGDVIVSVDRQPVAEPGDVARRVGEAKAANHKAVLVLVARGADSRFIALPLQKA
ncbi:MAG: Do family serine endopeptidase [Proteobacteria bacterium]|nr:Do family serine endopeptidase [Pseudomonadota bacterium]